MARVSECIASEKEATIGIIRLIKGNMFLRAYNKSAWKFHTLICDYKVKREFIKSIGEEVFSIGFPNDSLNKVADGRQLIPTDLGFDMILKPEETPADDSKYEEWCSQIPLSNASKSEFDFLPLGGVDAEKEVIRRIRTFPIERKTPIDCQYFVSELRELLDPQR